jgi:hypothetical protein
MIPRNANMTFTRTLRTSSGSSFVSSAVEPTISREQDGDMLANTPPNVDKGCGRHRIGRRSRRSYGHPPDVTEPRALEQCGAAGGALHGQGVSGTAERAGDYGVRSSASMMAYVGKMRGDVDLLDIARGLRLEKAHRAVFARHKVVRM